MTSCCVVLCAPTPVALSLAFSLPFLTSGLNSGVSINCKNKFRSRFLRPSRLDSALPLFNRSASRSMSSTIDRVRLQSNSFTVHFTGGKSGGGGGGGGEGLKVGEYIVCVATKNTHTYNIYTQRSPNTTQHVRHKANTHTSRTHITHTDHAP